MTFVGQGYVQQTTDGRLRGDQISFTAGNAEYTGRVSGNIETDSLDPMQADAYGMFLVHYPIALWLQYWLFDFDLPAIVKAAVAFAAAVPTEAALLTVPRVIVTVEPLITIVDGVPLAPKVETPLDMSTRS